MSGILSPFGAGGKSSTAAVSRVAVFGHSYVAGWEVTESAGRWSSRLAALLSAEEYTSGVTAAVLATDYNNGSQPGGYPLVINGLVPLSEASGVYTVRNAAPYLAFSPVTVFDYGFNDLCYLQSSTATNVAWFKMALRACTCIALAGGWFPDTDGSVAYGGSWNAGTNAWNVGWPTFHDQNANTTGGTVTITVPADFPGGEIDLLTLTESGGTRWSTVVDGGSAQVLDGTGSAYGAASGRFNLVVQRLTGLAAGTHTIVMTNAAVDTGAHAAFQGWLIRAPQSPVVVLVNQPVAPTLPFSPGGSPAHTPVTSSDVGSLNTAISALVTEFGGTVVLADIATAFANAGGNVTAGNPGSLWLASDIHFNAAGHALTASTVYAAVAGAYKGNAGSVSPGALVTRQLIDANGRPTGGGQQPGMSTNWTRLSGGVAWFGKDQSGNTILRLQLVNTSSPSAPSTIFTLPAGYWPAETVTLRGTSWTAGTPSAGTVTVTNAGAVQWQAGTPATEFDVFASFPADGPGGFS